VAASPDDADRRAGAPSSAASLREAAWIFATILAGCAALALLSAWLFAGLDVLFDPQAPERLHPTVRFAATLALVLAYAAAAARLGGRFIEQDLDALRPVAPMADAEWQALRRAARSPRRAPVVASAACGALFGLAVSGTATWLAGSRTPSAWPGLAAWVWLLTTAVFAVLGILAFQSAARGALFTELGRRSEVSLLDMEPLRPFGRAGLRMAAFWILGSSLASLLLFEASPASLVGSVIAITVGIGLLSLFAPSRGIHARLRAAKQSELAWLRGEIARARRSLGGAGEADQREAARLPALLAWETRVASLPEWPIDAPTFLRFALLALLPLGSWLAGALVERAVNAVLG
jgi:hypothetical protein